MGKREQIILKEVGINKQILSLFDLQPDVSFFIKDTQGRFLSLNRRSCEYCGVRTEYEALAKTDFDFFPSNRAAMYQADDRRVIETGQPIVNRIEPAPEDDTSTSMVVVNKIPLRNEKGRIVAVAGFSRRVAQSRALSSVSKKLSKAVEYLHRNFSSEIKTSDLAKQADLSVRQFERSFKKALGTTVRQYLLRIRLDHAQYLLQNTEDTILIVALSVGFYDHAHFTRTFTREKGISPKQYRNQDRKA
jgi:AraC-like DNA-binding protein